MQLLTKRNRHDGHRVPNDHNCDNNIITAYGPLKWVTPRSRTKRSNRNQTKQTGRRIKLSSFGSPFKPIDAPNERAAYTGDTQHYQRHGRAAHIFPDTQQVPKQDSHPSHQNRERGRREARI